MGSAKDYKEFIKFMQDLQAKETDENAKEERKGKLAKAEQDYADFISNSIKKTPISSSSSDTVNSDKLYDRGVKAISSALKELPTYNGLNISETERYLAKLNQFFTLLVTGVNENLEGEFLSQIKLKLGDNVWKHLDTTKPDISNFEKYKIFINTNYGGFQNAFQVVNRAFDIEFDPNQKNFIFSNKLTDELRTSLAAIKRHYNKIDGDKELTASECIDFIGALCVSQKLKEHDWELFRDMTNDFDKLKSANEVAQKAEFYRERLQSSTVNSTSFWGKSESKKQPEGQACKREGFSTTNKFDLNDPQFRAYAEKFDPNFKTNRPFKNWSDRKGNLEKSQINTVGDQNTATEKNAEQPKSSSFVSFLDEKSPFH